MSLFDGFNSNRNIYFWLLRQGLRAEKLIVYFLIIFFKLYFKYYLSKFTTVLYKNKSKYGGIVQLHDRLVENLPIGRTLKFYFNFFI